MALTFGLESAEGWDAVCKVLAAAALALPIALDRERANRIAGLRTFPLVAMTACSFMVVGIPVLGEQDSHARFMAGLITGLGFLGGGAILKDDNYAQGMATAASVWLTGAIGMAAAYGRFEIALLLSVGGFLVLRGGTWLKNKVDMEGADEGWQHPGQSHTDKGQSSDPD